ncbi:MAG: type II secretion system F family protein [Acidobacteriota bacterium]
MPTYTWQGRNRFGQFVKGERVASSIEEVSKLLHRDQIVPINIERKKVLPIPPILPKKVSLRELAVLSRQFAVMFSAGLPIVQSLEILGTQQTNKHFREAILEVKKSVEEGSTLNNALKKFPKIFNELYCNMIASGEASGNLDLILQRISAYMEKSVKLRGQIRSAMAYPIGVISVAIIILSLILWKIIPAFKNLFQDLGASLPFFTQVVISLSNFFANNILLFILIITAGIFGFRQYYKTYRGRRTVDAFILKIYVFGELIKKISLARFARTLSTLISSGVPMLEAMSITSKTAGNSIIEDSVNKSRESVAEGNSLGDSLKVTKTFPPMVVQMINAGEQTGALDEMLDKVAEFYEDEVEKTVQTLVSLLEPAMIVFLGILIGGIVISMYLPLIKLLGEF